MQREERFTESGNQDKGKVKREGKENEGETVQ